MSKTLTVTVPDEIHRAYEQLATESQETVEKVVLEVLTRSAPRRRVELTPQERAEALAKLNRHIGAFASGNPRSADNELIDADLAKEYGDSHSAE